MPFRHAPQALITMLLGVPYQLDGRESYTKCKLDGMVQASSGRRHLRYLPKFAQIGSFLVSFVRRFCFTEEFDLTYSVEISR